MNYMTPLCLGFPPALWSPRDTFVLVVLHHELGILFCLELPTFLPLLPYPHLQKLVGIFVDIWRLPHCLEIPRNHLTRPMPSAEVHDTEHRHSTWEEKSVGASLKGSYILECRGSKADCLSPILV